MGIGMYFATRKNYKRGKEHGSAKWGNPKKINKKYKQLPENQNRILTQNVRLGLNAKKHRRNLFHYLLLYIREKHLKEKCPAWNIHAGHSLCG